MKHLVNWIEIPVADLKRAQSFYNSILGGVQFTELDMGESQYALFPSQDRFNCGTLVKSPNHMPSTDGITVYLDGGNDMNHILDHVGAAGGQVLMPKTFFGEDAGYVGLFLDTEGNKIGLQHL
jgi:uncharacterized protein